MVVDKDKGESLRKSCMLYIVSELVAKAREMSIIMVFYSSFDLIESIDAVSDLQREQ